MKTPFIVSISFLRKLIEHGRIFSGKTPAPSSSLLCFFLVARIIFLLLLPFISYSQPALVKDINKIPLSVIAPLHLTSFNGVLYFSAQSTAHGRELWRSDGTDAGTYLLKDITPGSSSSAPEMFTVVNNTLYFVANQVHKEDYMNYEFEHHYELWKTDGTSHGTVQVGYFPMQSPQINLYEAYPQLQLVATNEALYFTVNNAPTGYELWKTQGSTTEKMLDVTGNPYTGVYLLRAAGNNVYFTASNSSANITLWRTDGTTTGTTLVKESNTSYGISSLTALGDRLFFTFEDGQELWKSNGTPEGTQLVKEIKAGGLFNANGLLYFTVATNPTTQLWKSDGTTEGTVLVKEGLIGPAIQTAIGTTIYFISSFQLWKSDGTAAGTLMVTSFEHEASVSIQAKAANSIIYIRVYANHTYVLSLWKSDGTSEGTVLLQEFSPYENDVFSPFLVTLQESAYFVARETLWKSSGTPDSTLPVYPGGFNENEGSYPSSLLPVNGLVYFTVGDGVMGFELWKTDGSTANTILVKRNGGTSPRQRGNLLAHINNTVYYQVASYDIEDQYQLVSTQLWKSDGDASSTVLVKTFETNTDLIGGAVHWNGHVYFFIDDQLWKSDGSETGTVLVKNINPNYQYTGLLTVWNNALYFKDRNSLWKSDGTPEGTIVIKTLNESGGIGLFTPANGQLYFTDYSYGIWKTDGTPAGTIHIYSHIGITGMVFFNGAFYFTIGSSLYKSDGTAAGTTLIKTIFKHDMNDVENLTVVGNTLYFTFKSTDPDLKTYDELWKSDGTPEGTQVVKVIKAQNLKSVSNTLLFETFETKQLWRSNGTAENTGKVADLRVQLIYSAATGSTLYFNANDGSRGEELWKYDVEACLQNPITNLLVEGSTSCFEENGTITIKGSETGFTYQAFFRGNGSPVGTAVPGGGEITLTIPSVNLSTGDNQFTIKAGGCILTTLTTMATITVTDNCNSLCNATGSILQEVWRNVEGSLVRDIPLSTPPTASYQLTSFETATNAGNNYGERIRGYICVPQTGSYIFYIAGDDRCELYLSTDDDPAKKVKIASVPYFTSVRQWNKYTAQKSVAITLVAGKKYYIEALHKEGFYLDNLAVGWQTSATSPISVIPGSALSPYVPQGKGKISREYWANVTGSLVSDIPVNTPPTNTSEITVFETATNSANNYGQRIRGYMHPQVSGNYRFYIAGDDRCELYVSSDEALEKKTKIAWVPYFTCPREWNKYSAQKSAEISLVAGRKYYIEALHKEGLYSDNLAVGWQLPAQSTIAVIAGNYLSPFLPTENMARVGVEENPAGKLSIYPNPFENTLTLSSSRAGKRYSYISIVDNLGRIVYQNTIQGTENELDLAALKAGVYVVKVATEYGVTQLVRVVKK